MKKILFVAPTEGNGGIQTLVRDYIRDFNFQGYTLTHIGVSHRRSTIERSSPILRAYDGLLDMFAVYVQVRKAVSKQQFDIFHTTTSGSIGTLRDFLLGRLCKRHGIKTILHCHYGCIPQDYRKGGIMGLLLKKTMHMYDNIWVLDNKAIDCLHSDPVMKDKTKLVPNPIQVPTVCDFGTKNYTKVAFIGNMYRTKGIIELVEAVSKLDNTTLHIIGPNYNQSHSAELCQPNRQASLYIWFIAKWQGNGIVGGDGYSGTPNLLSLGGIPDFHSRSHKPWENGDLDQPCCHTRYADRLGWE